MTLNAPPSKGPPRTSSSSGRQTVYLAQLRHTPDSAASTTDIDEAVRAAAQAATDFSWLAKDDTVFIKPVHNSRHPYPATTHPGGVAAMIRLLREKGAGRIIVGDMAGIESVRLRRSGLKGSTRGLMRASGLAGAVEQAGAELHCFEEAGWHGFYEDVPSAGDHWKRGLMMPGILKQVDHIVLMPRCGRHVLLGTTMGLKAAVGYWRTDTRLEYHRDAADIHAKTAESNSVKTLVDKQRLVVTVADRIMAAFGPDKGLIIRPKTGLVIGATDVVAHDMVSLAWLIENRRLPDLSFLDRFMDTSRIVAALGNRFIVFLLGGLGTALRAEALCKQPLLAVRDDPVLGSASRVFGGRPDIVLETVGTAADPNLRQRLASLVADA